MDYISHVWPQQDPLTMAHSLGVRGLGYLYGGGTVLWIFYNSLERLVKGFGQESSRSCHQEDAGSTKLILTATIPPSTTTPAAH